MIDLSDYQDNFTHGTGPLMAQKDKLILRIQRDG